MDDSVFLGSFLSYVVAAAALCGIAGFLILDRVGKGRIGVLLGALFGPIGLGIAAVMRGNALREQQAQGHRATVGLASQPGSPLQGELDALERLAKLREAGHLTEEEFQAKKRQLLGSVSATQTPVARPLRRLP